MALMLSRTATHAEGGIKGVFHEIRILNELSKAHGPLLTFVDVDSMVRAGGNLCPRRSISCSEELGQFLFTFFVGWILLCSGVSRYVE